MSERNAAVSLLAGTLALRSKEAAYWITTAMELNASMARHTLWLRYAALLLAPTLVLWPVLSECYAISDDYEKLLFARSLLTNSAAFASYAADGRLLYAWLMPFVFRAQELCSLWLLRLLALAGLGLLAASLRFQFRTLDWPPLLISLFSILSVLSLPSIVYAAWASLYPFPLACVAALWSGYLLAAQSRPRIASGRSILSALLLLTSLCLYQPSVGFFWIAWLPRIIDRSRALGPLCLQIFVGGCFFASLVLLYFLGYRFGVWPFLAAPSMRGSGVVANLATRIAEVSQTALLDSLRLWYLPAHTTAALPLALLLLLWLLLRIREDSKRGVLLSLWVLLSWPLCYLPNLAASFASFSFRTQAALHVLVLFYVFAALKDMFHLQAARNRSLQLVSLALLLIVGFSANMILREYFIRPQQLEYQLLQNALRDRFEQCPQTVHVIRPSYNDALSLLRYDEFGAPSSAQAWGPGIMVPIALADLFSSCGGAEVSTDWDDGERGDAAIDLAARFRALKAQ